MQWEPYGVEGIAASTIQGNFRITKHARLGWVVEHDTSTPGALKLPLTRVKSIAEGKKVVMAFMGADTFSDTPPIDNLYSYKDIGEDDPYEALKEREDRLLAQAEEIQDTGTYREKSPKKKTKKSSRKGSK